MFPIVLKAKMCEMFPVKRKPCINLDTMFSVWQRANVMYVTGQRAMSLLFKREGRRGGVLRKKMQVSFPGCPPCCDIILKLCLCWECEGEGPPFVFAYLCACLYRGVCCSDVAGGAGGVHGHTGERIREGGWSGSNLSNHVFYRWFDRVCLCVEGLMS